MKAEMKRAKEGSEPNESEQKAAPIAVEIGRGMRSVLLEACDEVLTHLRTLLPRDGDVSYLSSSHFTTDDEDNDYALAERTKRRALHKRKKKAKSQRILRHSVGMFLKFADLGVVPPTTLPDVESTISEITELQTRYKEEISRQRADRRLKQQEEEAAQEQHVFDAYNQETSNGVTEHNGDVEPNGDGEGIAGGDDNESNNTSHYSVDGESEDGDASRKVHFAENEDDSADDEEFVSLFD